jgi:hypothetical protein
VRQEKEMKMLNEDESKYLAGRLSQQADIEHQERMNLIIEHQEMNLFNMLRPSVSQDGDQFCVLYGEDLQSGIAGFGDTIRLAIYDFNKRFNEKAIKPKDRTSCAQEAVYKQHTTQ